MEPLLYLVHRIPYPPNKGDKIRSYHLLQYLQKRFDVILGTFIDNKEDWKHLDYLETLCKEIFVQEINPSTAKIRSLKGFVSGQALTLPYYQDSKMSQWVKDVIRRYKISQAMVFSSSMAQYVLSTGLELQKIVIDFVDMDSDKWKQYSESKSWPMNWIYSREGDLLLKYELEVTNACQNSLFVSKDEAEMFKKFAGPNLKKVDYYNNGVDADYFSPNNNYPTPYEASEGPIYVFTGAMDYWANADAAIWFVNNVFTMIQSRYPGARFYVVGSKPTPELVQLGLREGVHVTGFVEDVRTYIHHADVVVAPLQIARGVQNKVLEAMAMEKVIVATAAAVEGIDLLNGYSPIVKNSAEEFAEACIEYANINDTTITMARQCVLENYNWEKNLKKLDILLP